MARANRKPQRRVIVYDPRKIFALAEEFHRATDALAQANWNAPIISKYSVIMYPGIVTAAFSLELYFKCLFVMDHARKPDRDHNLVQLFKSLKRETQEEIIKRFDPSEGQPVLKDLKRSRPQAVQWAAPINFDFVSALYCSSRAFEYARYAYERDAKASEQWLGSPIVNAVRSFILEANPTWRRAILRENLEVRISPTALSRLAQKRGGKP